MLSLSIYVRVSSTVIYGSHIYFCRTGYSGFSSELQWKQYVLWTIQLLAYNDRESRLDRIYCTSQRHIKSWSALVHNYCYKFRSRFSSATISCRVGFAWQVKKFRDHRKNIVEYYESWIPEATVSRRWFALTWINSWLVPGNVYTSEICSFFYWIVWPRSNAVNEFFIRCLFTHWKFYKFWI